MYLYYENLLGNFEKPKAGASKEVFLDITKLDSDEDLKDNPILVGLTRKVMEVGSRIKLRCSSEHLTSNVSISSFFGNCGICILSGYEAYSREKAKLNHEMFDYALSLCKQMGYSQVLYSVHVGQTTITLLKEKGFKPLEESSVKNKRSGNKIQIWYLNI